MYPRQAWLILLLVIVLSSKLLRLRRQYVRQYYQLFCVERLDLLCAGHQLLFFGLPPLCYSLRLKANRGIIFFSPWCATNSSIGSFIIDQPP